MPKLQENTIPAFVNDEHRKLALRLHFFGDHGSSGNWETTLNDNTLRPHSPWESFTQI